MNIIRDIRRFIDAITESRDSDPVLHCKVYRETGCAHIDGYLCNMKICAILSNRLAMDIECPVCGYYCNGKGGMGCVDKPKLCGGSSK